MQNVLSGQNKPFRDQRPSSEETKKDIIRKCVQTTLVNYLWHQRHLADFQFHFVSFLVVLNLNKVTYIYIILGGNSRLKRRIAGYLDIWNIGCSKKDIRFLSDEPFKIE
jgi:hypothetical protein